MIKSIFWTLWYCPALLRWHWSVSHKQVRSASFSDACAPSSLLACNHIWQRDVVLTTVSSISVSNDSTGSVPKVSLGRVECTTCIMWPIATDDSVAWCVSHLICLSRCWAVQKRLNGLRSSFGLKLMVSDTEGILYYNRCYCLFLYGAMEGSGWNFTHCKVYEHCWHLMQPSPNYFGLLFKDRNRNESNTNRIESIR